MLFATIAGGAEEEKLLIKDTCWDSARIKKDETYYIINAKWLSAWKSYVHYDEYEQDDDFPRPGPINNEVLIKPDTEDYIRKDVNEGRHYEILPEKAWQYFAQWYGGGPPLPRRTIKSGYSGDQYVVEVRQVWYDSRSSFPDRMSTPLTLFPQLFLKIVKSSEPLTEVPMFFSKVTQGKGVF